MEAARFGKMQGIRVENPDEYGAEMPCLHSWLFLGV